MPGPDDNIELAVAYEADSPTSVVLVHQYIESNGIRCQIVGETLYNNTDIAAALKPQVLVRKTDLPAARQLVGEFEASRKNSASTKSDWKCQNCDEMNPANFDSCWHCDKFPSN